MHMYLIENNEIIEKVNYNEEADGTAMGYVALSQSTEPNVGWTRADEDSDFTDERNWRLRRRDAYPYLQDQLDSLYRDIENDTLTTSGEFYTALNTVKTDIPKTD